VRLVGLVRRVGSGDTLAAAAARAGAQVAVLKVFAGAAVVGAVGSVSGRSWVVALPGALLGAGSAGGRTIAPGSPVTPVSIYVSLRAVAIWSEPSVVADAFPWVVDALAVLAVPVGHALGAVLTSPPRLAPTLLRQVAISMFGVASLFADGLFAGDSLVLAEALALERLVHASAVLTVQTGLTLCAVRTTPTRVTSAHSWHDAFSMFAIGTIRLVASHSLPSGFADAFQAPVTKAVETSGQRNALLAKLTPPSHFTVTGEWFGAISVDACVVVDGTHRCLAQVHRIRPTWQTSDLAVTVAVIRATILQIFSYTSELEAFVERGVIRFGLAAKAKDRDNEGQEYQESGPVFERESRHFVSSYYSLLRG